MILMACLMYVFHKFQRRYLTDNNIGDTGATSLSEALKSNTTLTSFSLISHHKKNIYKMHPSTDHVSPFINRQQDWRHRSIITE